MTLEASLLMPMVICVIALLIYFSYYLYGRCVLSQDVYILAFRAANTDNPEFAGHPAEYVARKGKEKLGNKYFGSTLPTLTTDVRGDEVLVKGSASVRHSAMGRYFLKPQKGWEYEAAGRGKRMEYAEHIRKITRYKDIGKEIVNNLEKNNGS